MIIGRGGQAYQQQGETGRELINSCYPGAVFSEHPSQQVQHWEEKLLLALNASKSVQLADRQSEGTAKGRTDMVLLQTSFPVSTFKLLMKWQLISMPKITTPIMLQGAKWNGSGTALFCVLCNSDFYFWRSQSRVIYNIAL